MLSNCPFIEYPVSGKPLIHSKIIILQAKRFINSLRFMGSEIIHNDKPGFSNLLK